MKFGDKLIVLRKKNGLSQEELADKLGVSRQSVSKWESNNTYPETDKIVQICNLFDCSMDDLINDKVTDVEGALRKNKNNFNEVWDSLLDFITKTINMFSHMNFSTGFKCVVKMVLIAFLLWLIGITVCGISSSLIANIFSFLGSKTVSTIQNVLRSIFNILWFIIAVITLVHTFKLRYLNYYDDSLKNEEKIKDKKDEKKINNSKDEKIINRDSKNEPYAFLNVLSRIVLFFIKFIVAWIAVSSVFTLIGLVIIFVISVVSIPTNMMFVGSSLAIAAAIVISILFLLLCIYFIVSKKVNIKVFVIVFISSLIVFGIGIGVFVLSIKNLDIINKNESKNLTVEKLTIPNESDLVVMSKDINEYSFIVDNTIPNDSIKLEVSYNHDIKELKNRKYENDRLNVYSVYGVFNTDYKENYKLFVEDLKNNKIDVDHLDSGINSLTIKANSENINKLISNLEKLYLLEKNTDGNVTKVIRHRDRVIILNGKYVEYDARKNELIYNENAPKDYKCFRTIRKDTWGEVIKYECSRPDDDYDFDEELEEDYD